jgi:hypothetical protein
MTTMCRVVWLFAGLALTGAAQADEPAAPNAQSLGTIEAILGNCAELDAAHAAQYRDQLKLVTQGASEETMAKVRASDEYQQAYESARKSLAASAGADALKACKGSLAPGS